MKINFKAALLSALVFPGLGQFHKGDRAKGMIIFALVNMLLLVLFFLVMRQLLPLVISTQGGSPADTAKVLLKRLYSGTPSFRFVLAAFGGFWLYGWIDAAIDKTGRE